MSSATLSVLLALMGPTATAPTSDDAPPAAPERSEGRTDRPVASPTAPAPGGTARTAPPPAAPPTPRETTSPQPSAPTRAPDGSGATAPTPDDPSVAANPDGGGGGTPPGGGPPPGGGAAGAGGGAPAPGGAAAPSGGGTPPTPPTATPPAAAPSGSPPTPGGGADIKPLRGPRLPGSALDETAAREPRFPGFERDQKNLRDPFESNGPRRVTRVITYAPPPPPPPAPEPRDDHRMFFGGYGGPVGRLSAVSGKVATLAGFEGGVLIGERLSFGGAAYRMTWRQGRPLLDEAGNDYTLRMRYGGFNVGVTLWRPSILEFQIESLLGAGVACVSTAGDYSDDNGRCVETVKMFVGEPGAAMYINVTDWMRVAITGGYRVVVREPWRPPNEYLLSGGYGGIDLHFGWFRKPPPRRRR